MKTFRLTLEYDGTAYAGFQIQANAPTIQGELEAALYKATQQAIRITGAGRTDAGVHAQGQVVSFQADLALAPATLQRALNHYLPADIAVQQAAEAPPGFDARRSARSRTYRYRILEGQPRSPLRRFYVFHLQQSLAVEAMNQAAAALLGEHDFSAFAGLIPPGTSTRRRVLAAAVRRVGDEVHFEITANAFLTHQVRATVGTLIWVGTGKIDAGRFREILHSGDRRLAGPNAPAHGLCLTGVEYPDPSWHCLEPDGHPLDAAPPSPS